MLRKLPGPRLRRHARALHGRGRRWAEQPPHRFNGLKLLLHACPVRRCLRDSNGGWHRLLARRQRRRRAARLILVRPQPRLPHCRFYPCIAARAGCLLSASQRVRGLQVRGRCDGERWDRRRRRATLELQACSLPELQSSNPDNAGCPGRSPESPCALRGSRRRPRRPCSPQHSASLPNPLQRGQRNRGVNGAPPACWPEAHAEPPQQARRGAQRP